MQEAHNSLFIYRVPSHIVLSILIKSAVPFPLLNPNRSPPSTPKISFSILFGIHATVFGVCVSGMIVQRSPHFVTFGIFFKAVLSEILKPLSSFMCAVGHIGAWGGVVVKSEGFGIDPQ